MMMMETDSQRCVGQWLFSETRHGSDHASWMDGFGPLGAAAGAAAQVWMATAPRRRRASAADGGISEAGGGWERGVGRRDIGLCREGLEPRSAERGSNVGGKVNVNSIGASRDSGIACLIWAGARVDLGCHLCSGCCRRGPIWRGCLTFLETLKVPYQRFATHYKCPSPPPPPPPPLLLLTSPAPPSAMQQPTLTNIRIRSTRDALQIFYAVARNILPMTTRRLDAEERRASVPPSLSQEQSSELMSPLQHHLRMRLHLGGALRQLRGHRYGHGKMVRSLYSLAVGCMRGFVSYSLSPRTDGMGWGPSRVRDVSNELSCAFSNPQLTRGISLGILVLPPT